MMMCPNCQSQRVTSRDLARKYFGLAGVLTGMIGFTSQAELGQTVGTTLVPLTQPPEIRSDTLNTCLGILFASACVGLAGAKLGALIDDKVLDNYQCLDCHLIFGQSA
jgi:hypothetical protein